MLNISKFSWISTPFQGSPLSVYVLFCRTGALSILAVSFLPCPKPVSFPMDQSLGCLPSSPDPTPSYILHAAAKARSFNLLLNAHQRIPTRTALHNLHACPLSGLISCPLYLTHSAVQPLACFCSLMPARCCLGATRMTLHRQEWAQTPPSQ